MSFMSEVTTSLASRWSEATKITVRGFSFGKSLNPSHRDIAERFDDPGAWSQFGDDLAGGLVSQSSDRTQNARRAEIGRRLFVSVGGVDENLAAPSQPLEGLPHVNPVRYKDHHVAIYGVLFGARFSAFA